MPDPDWLVWAREVQAIAQTGLEFSKDPYDRDRFAALRRLSAQIMAGHTGADVTRIRFSRTSRAAETERCSASL